MVGLGSVSLVASSASAGAALHLHSGGSFAKGFTKGRIRTLLKARTLFTGSGLFNTGAGIVCMQAVENLTASNAANDAYIFGLGYSNTNADSPNYRWFVRKMPGGFGAVPSGAEYLYEGSTFAVTAGEFWPIQFEWTYDAVEFGGTRLIASVGTKNSTDFATLAAIDTRIDLSAPLSTSVAEGICLFHRYSVAGSHAWDFDTTEMYRLT
jgi:hypothetical protein